MRELIENHNISACHDISDGGLLVSLFEMSGAEFGCDLDISSLTKNSDCDAEHLFFGEDQARYVVTVDPSLVEEFKKKAEKKSVAVFKVGCVIKDKIKIDGEEILVKELQVLNEAVLLKKFS